MTEIEIYTKIMEIAEGKAQIKVLEDSFDNNIDAPRPPT